MAMSDEGRLYQVPQNDPVLDALRDNLVMKVKLGRNNGMHCFEKLKALDLFF